MNETTRSDVIAFRVRFLPRVNPKVDIVDDEKGSFQSARVGIASAINRRATWEIEETARFFKALSAHVARRDAQV